MDWVVGIALGALALTWLNSVTRPARGRNIPISVVPGRTEVAVAEEYHDEYTPDEENSQLAIYQTLSDAEKHWADRCAARVANLLYSLAPEDATRRLFTFAERKEFDIPVNHRPRPKE
jgi:hypothetical protein